jgi:ABC-type sugar transport system ATPase subunit
LNRRHQVEMSAAATSAAETSAETGRGLVRVTGLAKAFGETQALRSASVELLAGEVHVIVGENGSGKSTLVKIIGGVHLPDAGVVELAGEVIAPLRSPRAARDSGIAVVFQEVLVAEARSVLDNVWLGLEGLVRSRFSQHEKAARAQACFEELLGRQIDLGTPVEELSFSDRQACGIVRALLTQPRVLILDEATSALDIATRDRLFAIMRRLSRDGVAIVFITHRMDEIMEIGDRITVMRSGETVSTLERGNWTVDELVRLMTGADRLTGEARRQAEEAAEHSREKVLSTHGLRLRRDRDPIDLELYSGELVGVAGLEGHGQDEFLNALRGIPYAGGNVLRHRDTGEVEITSPKVAAAQGIAFVPRERRTALFGWMTIVENFGMPTLRSDTSGGWLRHRLTRNRFAEYIRQLGIVLGHETDRITTLSGGNQQKVVIARWLAAHPRVLLLNDPTRGVDIATKRELYGLLAQLAGEGLVVVMLSSELEEHVELMDRVLVFREHALERVIERESVSRRALVSAFFGEESAADVG